MDIITQKYCFIKIWENKIDAKLFVETESEGDTYYLLNIDA